MNSNSTNILQFDQSWQLEDEDSGDISKARFILNRLFQDFPGSFAVRLWNGSMLYIGEGTPAFTFCLEQASVLRNMVLFSDPKRLAEAYFAGEIQIHGDFNAAMQLRNYFESLSLPLSDMLGLVFRALTMADSYIERTEISTTSSSENIQSQQSELQSMALNYDAPSDFYQLWLDDHMLHSCGYFGGATQDLNQAQHNQLELICLKLHLQHGDSVLDIGCGWGGLARWAAKHYGVFVHSITESREQYEFAKEEVKRQGLEHLITVELCDYSDLPASDSYDKIVNIGADNHVGKQNLQAYLAKVHSVLKPGGLFLHHAITTETANWQHEITNAFINRQIFPDGELSSLPDLQQQIQHAKFDVFNIEGLRRHHALTLRRWLSKLEQRHQDVTAIIGERAYRIWRLYMTACAIQFEQGVTGLHQIVAVRR
jgi:cyclopropane-fatty-acyl-phospholipid synthase